MTLSEIIQRICSQPGIDALNAMQRQVAESSARSLIIISPTGSGKTLAFGSRILRELEEPGRGVQALVIAPSRELVMQIDSVIRRIASGYKTVSLYGGHQMADETNSLNPLPDIIIATPGRLLDHLQRGTLAVDAERILVLDEYDKALQLGFEGEMKRIVKRIGRPRSIVLTSATVLDPIPEYLNLKNSEIIEAVKPADDGGKLEVLQVESFTRDKLDILTALLRSLPSDERSIVFVNHRDAAERVYNRLRHDGIDAGLYHGGLDQQQRATAIDLLTNGTTPVLVATDLAARGLDIEAVGSVIHYHLPVDEAAWTHRNGRTARQQADGRVYVITSEADTLGDFIGFDRPYQPSLDGPGRERPKYGSLYFGAGKKEKLSRGDIVGFILANSDLQASDIGKIAVHDHYALAAVPRQRLRELASTLAARKIKGKKVRISQVKI